jgi:hypothetical protein
MSLLSFSREDQRRILETAFEPDGDGFLFYRNRWSGGVPVTAAERDAYLRKSAFASRRAFYRKIAGRARGRRRDYGSASTRMATAFPHGWAVGLIALGSSLLIRGLFTDDDWRRWTALAGGVLTVSLGLWLLIKRRSPPS